MNQDSTNIKLLDCTLRDGGYYNNWDFSPSLIKDYLEAMVSIQVDYVEIGFRLISNNDFKGGCAFSTDNYINSLNIPEALRNKIGVMVNGSDILSQGNSKDDLHQVLERLFESKKQSPVTLVRIACHMHEFEYCLPAATWLKDKGYKVGFNLMQINTADDLEIAKLLKLANPYPIDVLYFADSMGSLNTQQITSTIQTFKSSWDGEIGIHAHDSMGNAVNNSMQAVSDGVRWVDCTVTGMGRGPGNAQTEYLSIELDAHRNLNTNKTKLLKLIRNHFKPLKEQYGWGVNPYYYLAGKYSVHPTYIQKMISDTRYNEEDIISVIHYLKEQGGGKFNPDALETARHFYLSETKGTWKPEKIIKNNNVLIIGTGPSTIRHCNAIESYIKKHHPFVIALNAQKSISEDLINARAACHPVRILADCHEYLNLPQSLIVPASMLPSSVKQKLLQKELLDFDIAVDEKGFEFNASNCTLPNLLVLSYVLAIATSGKAKQILLAGFDGYGADDPRRKEIDNIFNLYRKAQGNIDFFSITETRYEIPIKSVYGLN
jgi:4-hydroxy 2-oxovalerate aldolase